MAVTFALMNAETGGVGGTAYPQHADAYDVDAYAGETIDDSPRWAGRVWADQSVLDSLATEDDVALDAAQAVDALNNKYGDDADQPEWERRLDYSPGD